MPGLIYLERINFREIRGSHSGVAADSSGMWLCALSWLGYFPTFRRIVVPSAQQSKNPRNVRKCSPSDTPHHPRTLESSCFSLLYTELKISWRGVGGGYIILYYNLLLIWHRLICFCTIILYFKMFEKVSVPNHVIQGRLFCLWVYEKLWKRRARFEGDHELKRGLPDLVIVSQVGDFKRSTTQRQN